MNNGRKHILAMHGIGGGHSIQRIHLSDGTHRQTDYEGRVVMDREQRDKEENANIIKMVRDLKAREVNNSVAIIEKYHYITLAK